MKKLNKNKLNYDLIIVMIVYLCCKYNCRPPFGAFHAAAHFATWKSLAQPRVFFGEDSAESYVAFEVPMEG